MRSVHIPAQLLLLAAFLLTGPVAAMELATRSADSGAALSAQVEYVHDGRPVTARTGGDHRSIGHLREAVTARIQAEGHHDLELRLQPDAAAVTVLLEPLVPLAQFTHLAQRLEDEPDARAIQGFVRRQHDAAALAGATVTMEGHSTRTDAEGYFELMLDPARPGQWKRSDLHVLAPGIGEHRREGVLTVAGIARVLVALGAGTETRSAATVGALDRGARIDSGTADDGAPMASRTTTPVGLLLAPALDPPATIRVGFADAACTVPCCTNACDHTCVLPLETYVRRGLDSEWIASWNTHSLRAGSIAYRGYGAWRVANPIRTSFDICSSACCQVNDASTHSNTDAAIARTPGILLSRNGSEPFSSEYSSENNSWDDPDDGLSCSNSDLSCGDGFAGSPATGWSCLADPVGTGRGCFGHGRGMSQWGTQRWGLAAAGSKSWSWIVDHYYNGHGSGSGLRTAVMTSPLALENMAAHPAAMAPGSSFQIHATAANAAGATHAHLLIGASLYRSGVGYIDDPAHDTALVLAPGSQDITRPFQVPVSTPAGQYDLLVSLYLDVDENGTISSADLALALGRVNAAVQILPTTTALFADGFEGSDVAR